MVADRFDSPDKTSNGLAGYKIVIDNSVSQYRTATPQWLVSR